MTGPPGSSTSDCSGDRRPDRDGDEFRELFEAGLQGFTAARAAIETIDQPLGVLFEQFGIERDQADAIRVSLSSQST